MINLALVFLCVDVVLLSTHVDRQGVDISVAVLFVILVVCVCTVTNFSADNKAST